MKNKLNIEDGNSENNSNFDEIMVEIIKRSAEKARLKRIVSRILKTIFGLLIVVWAVSSLLLIARLSRIEAQNEFYKKVTDSNSCYWSGR